MTRTTWYASGSNLFSQYNRKTKEIHLADLSRILLEEGQDIADVTPSQIIIVSNSTPPKYSIKGFDAQDITLPPGVSYIISFLSNHDSLAGYLGDNGFLYEFSPDATTKSFCPFKHVSMGAHGDVLAVPVTSHPQQRPLLFWFKTLHSLLKVRDVSSVQSNNIIPLPQDLENADPIEVIKLVGGAGHFLIELVTRDHKDSRLYAWGDNRFGQLGSSFAPSSHTSSSTTTTSSTSDCVLLSSPTLVGLFTLQDPFVQVAAGDLHSAVITQDGALYMFGHNGQGQCGGNIAAHGQVELMNDSFEDDNKRNSVDSESMVVSVGCGGSFTAAIVDGDMWFTGANHYGQLCIGSNETSIAKFTKSTFFNGNAIKVLCSRYTTYIKCYEKDE